MSDSSRLDALELAVARLTREVVELRAELQRRGVAPPVAGRTGVASVDEGVFVSDEMRRLAAGVRPATSATSATSATGAPSARESASAPPPPPRTPGLPDPSGAPFPSRFSDAVRAASAGRGSSGSTLSRASLEAFIGRYGTLALAAFTILMGVGAFVGWAIRNGLIGPELRVAAGAVASGGVALVGWRLRRDRSPRFGSVLLALALAILHVVCWGAGPLLHVVPDAVALGAAAAASAALAWLALREEDQSLFNVGFGGALLAPFVTASDAGDPILLLVYGAVVLAAGMRALGERAWSKTPFVIGVGIAAYTAAASGQLSASDPWPRATAAATFALGASWLALVQLPGVRRATLALLALVAALGALAAAAPLRDAPLAVYALAALVTVTAFAALADDPSARGVRAAATTLIPTAALGVALQQAGWSSNTAAVLAATWAGGSLAAAVMTAQGARSLHALSVVAFGGLAIVIALRERDITRLVALAAFCGVAAVAMRRFVLRASAVSIAAWLSIGAIAAFDLLDERGQWITRPFVTGPSVAAAAVCAAWLLFSWHWARTGSADGTPRQGVRSTAVRLLGAGVTFAWIHTELSHTVSIDVSTFLLVAYYAITGVLAIGIGRARQIAALRQVGLALSVLAAVRALAETSSMSIGWKVGGYLLAGGFLLGVAYWYRGGAQPSDDREQATPAPETSGASGEGAAAG